MKGLFCGNDSIHGLRVEALESEALRHYCDTCGEKVDSRRFIPTIYYRMMCHDGFTKQAIINDCQNRLQYMFDKLKLYIPVEVIDDSCGKATPRDRSHRDSYVAVIVYKKKECVGPNMPLRLYVLPSRVLYV